MKKKIEIECPEDTKLNIYTKPSKHLKKSYGRYFSEEILNIAIDRDLSGTDFRVLLAIIGNLGYENIINISQKELGQQLNISQQSVSKTIKKLINKKYLQIIDKIGKQNIYKFNPNIAFKSRAKNHKGLCSDWKENATTEEINSNSNLNKDFQIKFQEKIEEISKEFNIEKNKAKGILLLIINEGLNKKTIKDEDLPY